MAHWAILDVKKNNLFAFETLTRSTNKRLGSPFGCLSDLSGLGSPGAFLFSGGIDLALEADPPGGAMKMPTTGSSANHCINRLTPTSVVKSAITTCAAACLFRMWSVPNALIMPILRSSAVTLAAPAKISITMQSEMSAPALANALMRPWRHFFLSWSFSAWGAKQPLRQQRCHPFEHFAPSAASEHLLI